jgi:hypothetical protein
MSEPTIRRAALGALASVPALAILPAVAIASPTSTARLADLIAAHRAAEDAVVDADEAASERADPDVRVSFLGRELSGDKTRLEWMEHIDFLFQREMWGLATLLRVSPELGEAARGIIEKGKADCLAQIDEAHTDWDAADKAVGDADKVQNEALLAVCAHRCNSVEELTIKVR